MCLPMFAYMHNATMNIFLSMNLPVARSLFLVFFVDRSARLLAVPLSTSRFQLQPPVLKMRNGTGP